MDTGFGVRITLHTDRLTRPLAGTGIGGGSLSTHGQAAQVSNTTIALDTLKTLQVQTDFTAKVTFDDILAFLDRMNDLGELLFVQVLGADAGIDACALKNDFSIGGTNAVNVTKGDLDSFLARNFNTNNTCHKKSVLGLALTLFVPGIGANHSNNTFAANNFTIFAKLFNRCANFHILKLR